MRKSAPSKQSAPRISPAGVSDLWSSLGHASPDPICFKDAELRYTALNPAYAKFIGITNPADALGKTNKDYFDGTLAKELDRKERAILTGQRQPSFGSERIRDPEGHDRWFLVRRFPIKNGDATIEGVGITMTEVTELHRAEVALRESEQKYRTLFDESRDAVFISSPEGKFLEVNAAAVDLFGYSNREELLAIDVRKELYLDPDDRAEYIKEIEEKGFVKDFELNARKKNGDRIVVLETATPFRDATGNIIAFRGILHDITQLKLLQQQLMQSQKLESLGTLAGGIAHDFNNILAIIIAYITRMERGKLNAEEVASHLVTIKKASWRGAELVRQILTFARKTETLTEPFNINSLIEELVTMLEQTFPKTITFNTRLDRSHPTISADHNQIQQIIMNLCVNARDAMPPGGTITLATELAPGDRLLNRFPDAHESSYLRISVADTGTGMTKEVIRRVFEPFFTTKAQGKGTGLGLAMVYGIIQNHRGFIDVDSEPGKGSIFSVYLPRTEEMTALNISVDPNRPSAAANGETILLIEDEKMLREFMKSLFENKGYSVLVAEDGLEALEKFTAHSREVSIVFSDMGLPNMDGWTAFRKMREIRPDLKTLFATGYIDPNSRSEVLKSGAKGIVQKPYIPEEILQTIRDLIDQQ